MAIEFPLPVIREDGKRSLKHVYPLKDWRDHTTDETGSCWCRPQVEIGYEFDLIIHNALDARERYQKWGDLH